ncbi:DgyrCDS12439 [Dimorphilus gyrociliatus]|uniref:Vesicle-associated membrane protein 7 n=1 Tax=Dimorphilus gyrociliatus TaxID=2664684 RepID=A0A7I8W7E8_9ANNE|nr:DgyrCDS12439 [Dimorphilus gyrociliatus]
MSVLYSCIARGDIILCQECKEGSSVTYENKLRSILPKLQAKDAKTSYESNGFMYHLMLKDDLAYVAVTDPSVGKLMPHTFLGKIHEEFSQTSLVQRAAFASPYEFNMDFSPCLAAEMRRATENGYGHIANLNNQVNEVKGIMTQNIESVLRRGENLEDLEDRTTALEDTSRVFQQTAKQVRRKYWWQNMKMRIILVLVVLAVIAVIVIIICASTGVFSKKSSSPKTTVKPSSNP